MLLFLALMACTKSDPVDTGTAPVVFGDIHARLSIPPASSLWVDTARIFACTGEQGLYTIDASSLTAPELIDITNIECHSVDGESGRVHVAGGESGLRIVHPGNLSIVGTYQTDFPVTTLTVDAGERQAWIAGILPDPLGGDDDVITVEGVLTYSLDALTPNKRAELDVGDPTALAYDRAGIFVAGMDGDIDVLGLAMDVRSTIQAGEIAGSAGAGLLAGDDILWVARGAQGLGAWDTSDLQQPVELPGWTSDAAWGLARIDHRLYVGSDEALLVLDITDPAAIVEVGRVALTDMMRPEGIYVLADTAFVTDASTGGLAIFDVDETTL